MLIVVGLCDLVQITLLRYHTAIILVAFMDSLGKAIVPCTIFAVMFYIKVFLKDCNTEAVQQDEDRATEKLTERNFIMLSSKYQKEQIELEEQIPSLKIELKLMEQEIQGAEKWIELIKEFSMPKELTATLLNAKIEKILIHTPETNESGERQQEIEIYYCFIGKVE